MSGRSIDYYKIVDKAGVKILQEPEVGSSETGILFAYRDVIEAINEVQNEGIVFLELCHGGWVMKEKHGRVFARRTTGLACLLLFFSLLIFVFFPFAIYRSHR